MSNADTIYRSSFAPPPLIKVQRHSVSAWSCQGINLTHRAENNFERKKIVKLLTGK